MKPQSRRLVAAGLAALVPVSAVVAGGGVTLAQEEAANAPAADELYVEDDGDAVLVHRSEGTDANETGLPPMTSVVSRTENGTTTAYVRVPEAVEGDPTEADLRALPGVDEDTTVHLPGTWDREFPTVDTERASEFLEGGPEVQVNATAGDGLDESDGDGLKETDGNETDGAAGEAAVGTVLPV